MVGSPVFIGDPEPQGALAALIVDAEPDPLALYACTANEYDVPHDNPLNCHCNADVVPSRLPPRNNRYPPTVPDGASHATVTLNAVAGGNPHIRHRPRHRNRRRRGTSSCRGADRRCRTRPTRVVRLHSERVRRPTRQPTELPLQRRRGAIKTAATQQPIPTNGPGRRIPRDRHARRRRRRNPHIRHRPRHRNRRRRGATVEALIVDAEPDPLALYACTANEYDVPHDNPLNCHCNADVVPSRLPPRNNRYPPTVTDGASHATVTLDAVAAETRTFGTDPGTATGGGEPARLSAIPWSGASVTLVAVPPPGSVYAEPRSTVCDVVFERLTMAVPAPEVAPPNRTAHRIAWTARIAEIQWVLRVIPKGAVIACVLEPVRDVRPSDEKIDGVRETACARRRSDCLARRAMRPYPLRRSRRRRAASARLQPGT